VAGYHDHDVLMLPVAFDPDDFGPSEAGQKFTKTGWVRPERAFCAPSHARFLTDHPTSAVFPPSRQIQKRGPCPASRAN